jgi:hypothetical protein
LMSKVFKPKKEKRFGLMLLACLAFLLFFDWLSYPVPLIMIIITVAMTGLTVWIWFDTG